jgi:hypothetical protein
MKQQHRVLLVDGHKVAWTAQALTDDDGNVVLEEHFQFTLDGRPVDDERGYALLERLGMLPGTR